MFQRTRSKLDVQRSEANALENNGITSLARLAFAACHPGQTPTEAQLQPLLHPIPLNAGNTASLKRLIFESQTLVCNEVKVKANRKDDASVTLAGAERDARTSMTKETKTMLLPFTSLGRFLGSVNWAESFMDARSESGLHGQDLFLPTWNEVGQSWSSYPMSSGEATCWIRELLSSAGVEDYERFSSHSAKCTLLTWAGMTTLFTREERTLLGHHVEPQTRSATIYNRDSQIMLQYKVLKLINLIRTSKLKPDASRAERLAMMVENGSTADTSVLSEEVQEPEIEASDEESQDDVDLDGEDDPTTDLDGHLGAGREQVPEHGDEFLWYIHCFTGVVHAAQVVSLEDRLLCGRPITVNLVSIEVGSAVARTGLMCMQCNSVMKRHTGQDDSSEWERVSDERVELEEEL